MAMMKRVAESAVRAFALGSTSGALTKHLHVSIFFSAFLLQTQLIGWLTDEIDGFFRLFGLLFVICCCFPVFLVVVGMCWFWF